MKGIVELKIRIAVDLEPRPHEGEPMDCHSECAELGWCPYFFYEEYTCTDNLIDKLVNEQEDGYCNTCYRSERSIDIYKDDIDVEKTLGEKFWHGCCTCWPDANLASCRGECRSKTKQTGDDHARD